MTNKKQQKTLGLALGGGGARGCAHIGVIKALQEAQISIDYVAGSSIGAVVGGLFAAGRLDALEHYLNQLNKRDVLRKFDLTLRANGFFKGDRIMKTLEKLLQKRTFSDCHIPFAATALDVITGQELVLQEGDLTQAIRASLSIPGVFSTVKKGNYQLIDGGTLNPLPVDIVRGMGADVVIGVDLGHQYIEEKRLLNSDSKKKPKKWDTRFGVSESAVFLMLNKITQFNLKNHPAEKVLNMRLGATRLFDFYRAHWLIDQGYQQTKKHLKEIETLIQ